MIIFRYLAKEVYSTVAVLAGILILTFLSNAFVRYLTKAASGKLSGMTVLKIMAMQIPYLLGLLLPVSLFLAFLLAYGRLYVDSEMTVLNACGMGKNQLLKYSLLIALIIIILDVFLTFYISPMLSAYKDKLLSGSSQETILATLQPGRFQVADSDNLVFYIQSIDRKNDKLKNIFVAQKENKIDAKGHAIWNVMSATTGYSKTDPKTKTQFVIATNGNRYYGSPGEKNFKVVNFSEYGAKVNTAQQKEKIDYESMSNEKLWHLRHSQLKAMAELEWRISVPLSIPILTLLAVPLSRVRPRQGRYAQLLPAILIYAIYANMMFVAKDWVAHGKVSAYIGIWWLHVVLLLVAIWYWLEPEALRSRFKRWRRK
ncbi:MAG: LPS export ABC transporter permease LptF [Legionellales bacterium]|nr:LPS export ABC transporter permease LptF [Legionellales bacterium]